MVVSKYEGKTSLTLRGPETKASYAECPGDVEFFGIVLKLGTFMPHLPLKYLLNRQDMTLPQATSQKFWLQGASWQFPDFENADTFVSRLTRDGILAYDPVVSDVLEDKPVDLTPFYPISFLKCNGNDAKYNLSDTPCPNSHDASTTRGIDTGCGV